MRKKTFEPWSYGFPISKYTDLEDWGIVRRKNARVVCQVKPDTYDEEFLNEHRRLGTDPTADEARLIAAAPTMYEALANLENDAGQIPDHAWKLVQDALRAANPDWKVKP